MDPDTIAKLGPLGLLAGALIALVTGMVVPKWAYAELKAERDFWRQAYVDSSKLSQRLTTVATQVVERV